MTTATLTFEVYNHYNHKNVFNLTDAELNSLQSQINEQLRAKRTQFKQKLQKIKRER